MKRVGYRKMVIGSKNLVPVAMSNPPFMFPTLPKDHYLLCGLGDEENCELFYCETFADMTKCFNAANGRSVHWFTGKENLIDMSGSSTS